jgi:hypothetical protein
MASLWKFGGLTPFRLTVRAVEKIGENELSTRSAALSYYFILALFPLLLFLVSLLAIFAGPGSQLRESIVSGLGRLAPGSASELGSYHNRSDVRVEWWCKAGRRSSGRFMGSIRRNGCCNRFAQRHLWRPRRPGPGGNSAGQPYG